MRVRYCENSTITEAWCVLFGEPALFNEDDPALVRRLAQKTAGEFQTKPTFVAFSRIKDAPQPPFWTQQVTWGSGKHLARFGHRYLSVHFLAVEGEKYETYEESLQAAIVPWLEAMSSFAEFADDTSAIERLGFGYVNTFEFHDPEFDVSEYFALNFAVAAPMEGAELNGVETTFRFFDPKTEATVSIELRIDAAGQDDLVVVRTKVVAEMKVNDLTFADTDGVDAAVYGAKEIAKKGFFAFATRPTHELMGAVYDAEN